MTDRSSSPPNAITTPVGEPAPRVAGTPGVPVSDTGGAAHAAPALGGTPGSTPGSAPADEPKRLLSRTDILEASDTRYEIVPVPEWKSAKNPKPFVRVRSMAAEDRDAMERAITDSDEKVSAGQVRARIVSLCVVDEKGDKIFTPEDVAALAKKHVAPIQRIFEAVALLNAFTNEDVDSLAKSSGVASGAIS